jgi:hypothetical protein
MITHMIQSTQNSDFFLGNARAKQPVAEDKQLTPAESAWLEKTTTVVQSVATEEAKSEPEVMQRDTPTLKEIWAGTKERWNEMDTPQKIGTAIGLVRLTPHVVMLGAAVVVMPVAAPIIMAPLLGVAKGIDAFWRWRREVADKK